MSAWQNVRLRAAAQLPQSTPSGPSAAGLSMSGRGQVLAFVLVDHAAVGNLQEVMGPQRRLHRALQSHQDGNQTPTEGSESIPNHSAQCRLRCWLKCWLRIQFRKKIVINQ
jgi:hypothetical protein